MTLKISAAARSAVKSLAVRYGAYIQACDKGDDNGTRVWGWMLLQAQEQTGIVLCRDDLVHAMMNAAARRMEAVAA